MKRMLKRLTLLAATIVAAATLLAGCSGDDGANGLPGANGTNGTNGTNALVTASEACTTCHGTGSSNDVDTAHASSSTGNIAISNVVPLAVGADLVVTFNAKVNGVNKSNYDSFSADYRLDGGTMNRQDLSTDGTPATLVNNTNGNYTITIAGGATAYGAINSRYLLRIQNTAEAALASAARPAGYRGIVVFDYPAAPVTDLLGATSTSCADCHGSFGNGFHYGYPSNGGKTCVVCHDAANTNYPRLPTMVHGIHNSANMPTGKFTLSTVDGVDTWEYAIAFPSYMSNCNVCHQTGAPLTAANAKAVTYNFCMTCHQNWNGFGASTFGGINHSGYTAATNCAVCHDGATAPATVVAIHNAASIVTERGGVIYDGADVSVTEGAKINQQITGVTRTGNNLAITWTATYAGTPVDPCNATATATAPAFAYTGQNFSILKAFFQGDDLVNAGNGNTSPGQPNSTNVNFTAGTGNTACAANVATTTIALTTAEAALTGNGRVALQGKPQILFNPAKPATAVRAKSPIYDFALASGAAIPARRTITDTALCLKCHVGSLYQHGGNRVDSVELCVMCHNEASSEQNVRTNMGVTASEAYDGKAGQTYGFKSMLHAVHASGTAGNKPLVIYRTRGIYAFGPDVTAITNWPGTSTGETDKKLVYGANDPAAATSMQPHFFITAHYPRNLNDCSACHPSTFSRMPDQSKSVATTVNAGAAPWDNQLDDTLQGTTSAACTSCHQSVSVKAHAEKEGFVASMLAAGRQTIIDLFK